MLTTLSISIIIIAGVALFVRSPRFGSLARGERLRRVICSPNYYGGRFRNLHLTPQLTVHKGRMNIIAGLLLHKAANRKPSTSIPMVRTPLSEIPPETLVWLGHSSYIIRTAGLTMAVDPVLSAAGSPVPFFNRVFRGTRIWKPGDMPDLDCLIITHDHWDHLDYPTVRALRGRVRRIVCPLGVGANFDRWGFPAETITEMDWGEQAVLDGVTIHCLPARHFSGRKATGQKQTLWASFLIETDGGRKIYIGGDGGYDDHFAAIGKRFAGVDLALMENGQYGDAWKYIHMHPPQTLQAALDLRATAFISGHNSKFALANHSWDEPMRRLAALYDLASERDGIATQMLTPKIGEAVRLWDSEQKFARWWV